MADDKAQETGTAKPDAETGQLIIDPFGQYRYIDPTQAQEAVTTGGYRLPSPDETKEFALKQEHGNKPLRAFTEAALSGATFGGSRILANELGLTTPEEQAAVQKYSPIASGLGSAAGVVGPLLMPAAGALGALSAPVRGVSAAGQAVAKAALPGAERLAASLTARPFAQKIAAEAAAMGLGSAVEGAAYGLGESVNEAALGDPHLNAEKVLSNVGYSSLIAGGLGGLLGAGVGGLKGLGFGAKGGAKAAEGATPSVKEALAAEGFATAAPLTEVENMARYGAPGTPEGASLRGAVDLESMPKEMKETIVGELQKLKPNADAITEAARTLDAPVLEGMISDSKHIQRTESMLIKSPTTSGIERQALYSKAYGKGSDAVSDTLGKATDVSAVQLGNQLKSDLTAAFEAKAGPVQDLYRAIDEYAPAIPVTDKSTGALSRNIRKIIDTEGLIRGTPEYNFVENLADGIDQVKDIGRLKQFRTAMGRASSKETRYVAGLISEKLNNLEENAIKRFASTMKSPEAKAKITGLLDQIGEAKSGYKALRGDMERLGGTLFGKKKIYGPQDFLDQIDELTPEKFAKKIFAKENSEFMGWFSKNFPDQMKLVSQYERSAIRDAATKEGVFSPKKALTSVNDLSPEIQKILFTPEELVRMKHAQTYLESFPKDFNPSGTASEIAYRNYFANPAKAFYEEMADKTAKGFISRAMDQNSFTIKSLAGLERMARKTTSAITGGAKAVFEGGKVASFPAIGYGASQLATQFKAGDSQELQAKIRQLTSDPEHLFQTLEKATASVSTHAPNLSGALSQKMATAVSFLGSKLPVLPPAKPLSPKYQPNKAETAQFNHYVAIIENPMRALEELKRGTLTTSTMETLQAVYPKLHDEMKLRLMDSMTDYLAKSDKPVPYKTQLSLSLFMGQDMDNSLDQRSIASNQMALNAKAPGPPGGGNKSVKPTQSGLSSITKSERMQTPVQAVASDKGE